MRTPSIKLRTGSRRGVTLIELSFGLAIAAVIVGMAVPGFQSTLRAAAVRSASFDLLSGLQQTRGSAILESRAFSVCPSDAAGICVAAGVPTGYWRVSSDSERTPAAHALPSGVVIRATRSPLWFSADGLGSSNGTLTICDRRRIATPRAIVLSVTGRARLEAAPIKDCEG